MPYQRGPIAEGARLAVHDVLHLAAPRLAAFLGSLGPQSDQKEVRLFFLPVSVRILLHGLPSLSALRGPGTGDRRPETVITAVHRPPSTVHKHAPIKAKK